MRPPLEQYFSLQDAVRERGPVRVSVMVKPVGAACPLACRYCYYRDLAPAGAARMGLDLLETIVRETIEANDGEEVTFNWHGGEPLLAGLDFFREAVRLQCLYAGGKTIHNTLQTGGTLLTGEWAAFFREAGFLIGLSLDGPRDLHDRYRADAMHAPTFDRVLHALELLRSAGVEFNTLTTVNRASEGRGGEVYRFLKSLGSHYMQFLPVADRERPESVSATGFGTFMCEVFDLWVREDIGRVFVNLFDATLSAWCGLPGGTCTSCEVCGGTAVVESSGDVFPCDHFATGAWRLGNLRESGLREMVTSERARSFSLRKRNTLPARCLRCPYLFACGGECPEHRSDDSGLNVLCEGYLQFFEHTAPAMRQMRDLWRQGLAPALYMKNPVPYV